MPVRSIVAAAVGTALALACGPVGAQSASPMSAEQGWSAIGACAGNNASERARHACVDEVLRKAGLLTPQAEAKQHRQQFGLDGGAAPAAPAPAPVAKPPAPEGVERLEVQIARAVLANDGKIVVTTADGAVWRQTDSTTVPRLPAAGDTVKIRKASLGSYLCTMPSNHTFRCIRSR